jgi:hypothetical protein
LILKRHLTTETFGLIEVYTENTKFISVTSA